MTTAKQDFDVLIVGAGIAGASLAAALSPNMRVGLIEMEAHPSYHATGRSAALFFQGYGNPSIQALTEASRTFFLEAKPDFTDEPLHRFRDLMVIAREDQYDRLLSDISSTPNANRSWLTPTEAVAACPILREEYLAGAYVEQGIFDIDVDALHRGYLKQAGRSAPLLLNREVKALSRSDGMWTIHCEGLTLRAKIVVNAAGAWADKIAELAGLRPLGLTPCRRTAILFDPPVDLDCRDMPFVFDADEEFYLKFESGKLLASPGDEEPVPPGDVQAEEIDIAIAADRVMRATTLEIKRISHSWAGLRTFAPDRGPVIGYDPRSTGFFWSAGQGGYGIQTSPSWARTAAALLMGNALPADLATFGVTPDDMTPARFIGPV